MNSEVVTTSDGVPAATQIQQKFGTGNWSNNSMMDVKANVWDKEMLMSQMRKLGLENSSLQMENKLVKDKYNRATALISELENKLQMAQSEVDELQTRLEEESGRVQLTAKADMEREIEQHQAKAASAAKQVDLLRSEIFFMEEQLCSVHKELETMKQSADRSAIHETHRQEIDILNKEKSGLKQLLQETELALEEETRRCQNLVNQVQKLSQTNNMLRQQFDGEGLEATAAEKQIASIHMRLRVTEERLIQERADRAGNLSQIEEKLLSENAKLQTKSKELERQLKREKEKTRMLEQRTKDFREENLQLRLALPDEDEKNYDIPYSRNTSFRQENKRPSPDLREIIKALEDESGQDQEDLGSLLEYLWLERLALQSKMKEWRLYLELFDLPEGDDSLQTALMMTRECEAKMLQTEEKFEDISAERIASEQAYKQQLTELVKEKHHTLARLNTLEDLMDALRAENETLRQGLAMTSGQKNITPNGVLSGEDQAELLRGEIINLEAKLSQLSRKNKVLESELATLHSQLSLRDSELRETVAELKAAQTPQTVHVETDQIQQQQLKALKTEVAGLKEEISYLTERSVSTQNERQRLESELGDVKGQLRSAKTLIRQLESSRTQLTQVEHYEKEIEKKTIHILQVTSQLSEAENALNKVLTERDSQQKIHQEMLAQMEAIQTQLDQRSQMLDQLSARENEQLEQLEMVRGMILSLSQSMASREGEAEILNLELQQSKDKICSLEEQLNQAGVSSSLGDYKFSDAAKSLRRNEVDDLKSQILQAVSATASVRQECHGLNIEVNQVRHEASTAVANNIQVSNEKNLLERRLQTLEEEKKMMSGELETGKRDLEHIEGSFQEVVAKFEDQAKLRGDGWTIEEGGDSSMDHKELIAGLQSLRILTLAKEKEVEIILDKIRRQEEQKNNLERRCELLKQENELCHQDMTRITRELVLKVKENSATVEVNRLLLKDQSESQKKLSTLESQLTHQKELMEKQKAEVNRIIQQIEHCEGTQLSTSLALQQKESVISELEANVRHLSSELTHMQQDRDELRTQVEHLTGEIRNLKNAESSMKRKLEEKESAINDYQATLHKQKEEMTSLTHKLDLAKHEHDLLTGNLNSEKKVQETLKEEIKAHEDREQKLTEKVAQLTAEFDVQRGHLIVARENIQQLKAEKEQFMKDYHEACRRLGEKERTHAEIETKMGVELAQMKEESQRQREMVVSQRTSSERDLEKLKLQIGNLKEQLQNKDGEISQFKHSLKDIEDIQRHNSSLEVSVREQDLRASESKALVDSLRKEVMSLRDENAELQDTIARKVVAVLDLQDQLRSTAESSDRQATEMRHTIEGMRSHHEYERKNWRESSTKVEEDLKATKQELFSATQNRDQLLEQLQTKEQMLIEVSYQLNHGQAAQKLGEEKLEMMKETMDEIKQKKVATEGHVNSLQMECHSLRDKVKNLEAALRTSEKTIKLGEEKIEALKADLARQQSMLESYKQQSTVKLQRLSEDLRQQSETDSKDHLKVQQQAHKLSVELEQAREGLALKNKEILKLQEAVLDLEQQVREGETRLKHTQDSVRQGEELQNKLSFRFDEQENELKKLRNFLAKKADENGDGKSMWEEMNRVMSKLSQQLQFHLETSRLMEHGGQDDGDLVHKLRKLLLETESQLNTERALHQVTRSSMQALDEDCTRLRQNILAIRRRALNTDKKQKNRMEEINEIIARSQTRAHALMSSGEFSLDGSLLHNLTPSRDYNVGDASFSLDTSLASEASFADAQMAMSFLNLSGTFTGATPKK
ncbi:unnamed protein product [Lymnaea stagnalis]|uniref:Uncharacterized protein n=1 Tax=Lymnaea stagnalis TaxID=6523 RepID=A0AAV2HJ96_LYMST